MSNFEKRHPQMPEYHNDYISKIVLKCKGNRTWTSFLLFCLFLGPVLSYIIINNVRYSASSIPKDAIDLNYFASQFKNSIMPILQSSNSIATNIVFSLFAFSLFEILINLIILLGNILVRFHLISYRGKMIINSTYFYYKLTFIGTLVNLFFIFHFNYSSNYWMIQSMQTLLLGSQISWLLTTNDLKNKFKSLWMDNLN